MRRILTALTLGALVAGPAVVVTSTASSAVGNETIQCSIYKPWNCGGGGGKPYLPK